MELCWNKMAYGRSGRGLMLPLLIVNLVVYLIILGLAGWSLNKYIDGEQNHPHLGGNSSTTFMLVFALIAGVLGSCAVLYGFFHFHSWTWGSFSCASSLAIVSWSMTSLALGVVVKEMVLGGHRGKRLQTLEAFVFISAFSQLMYVVLLLTSMSTGYTNRPGYHGHGSQHSSDIAMTHQTQ